MIPGFEQIVEERIKKAQYKGFFDDLPEAGKPLDLTADQHIPEDLRLAHKILKNADCPSRPRSNSKRRFNAPRTCWRICRIPLRNTASSRN